MPRIAHISDLHVLSPAGVEWRRILFNKRITGYANLILHRGRVHRREYLMAVLAEAAARADHIVVTGDITNLALEHEYDQARTLLEDVNRSAEVTVVPGNHDIYLPSIHRERRFASYFDSFLRSDLPQFARDLPSGPFPCVKLRGSVAIIALSSAVPRPPFISAGLLGETQLEALGEVLAHPEVTSRTPVVLLHHPPADVRPWIVRLRDGLVDAAAFRHKLAPVPRGLVLFGHIHARVRCALPTDAGTLDVISATGAALDHPDSAVRAGFNVYEIDDSGCIASVEGYVIDPSGRAVGHGTIAQQARCL